MSGRRDESSSVGDWMEQAEQDLLAAESLLATKDPRLFNPVCYHSQQAAEKSLKAILLHLGIEFPFTHDLRLLLEILTERSTLDIDITRVVGLTRYATQARYPGDWEPIGRREAVEAVNVASALGKAVKAIVSGRRSGNERPSAGPRGSGKA